MEKQTTKENTRYKVLVDNKEVLATSNSKELNEKVNDLKKGNNLLITVIDEKEGKKTTHSKGRYEKNFRIKTEKMLPKPVQTSK